MELRHLRYFLAVADGLHFGRAAKRLHVSQPSVSQQVRQLEDELGTKLFDRLERGVRLTAAGETFRGYATRALEDVHAGERALRALERLEVGELRVGYPPSLTSSVVVPAMASVLRKYPGLRLVAIEGVTRRIEQHIAEGKLDVGLGFSPTREPDVEAEPVIENRLALVVSKRNPKASLERVSLRALEGEPFALLTRGMRVRTMVDAYFSSAKFSPKVVFEANAVATVLSIARAGLAVTLLPEPRLDESQRLAILGLSPSPPSHFAALLFRRGTPRSAAVTAFADEVRALAVL